MNLINKKIKISLILIITIFSLKAQDTISFTTVENKTLEYYYQGNWDSLIIIGNIALKNNHDYFYLRLRVGVAYYNIGKFNKAIAHLEKAYKQISDNEVCNEFLYLSYKNAGRTADAEYFSKLLNDYTLKRVNYHKKPFISSLYLESGISPASNYIPNSNLEPNTTSELSTKQDLLGYGFLGVTHQLNSKLLLFHGVSFLLSNNTFNSIQRDVFNPNLLKSYASQNSTSQIQYYINPRYTISKGLVFSSFIHYLSVNGNTITPQQDTLSQNLIFNKTNFKFNDFVGGFQIEKYYRNLVFTGGLSFNKLNNIKIIQGQIGTTWFPFSNANFYINGSLFVNRTLSSTPAEFEKTKTFYSGKIGGKIYKRLWAEASLYEGNIQNSHLNDGFLIFNSNDNYSRMANGMVMLAFNKFNISLRYQYSDKIAPLASNFINSNLVIETITKQYKYQKHTLTGGILWNF